MVAGTGESLLEIVRAVISERALVAVVSSDHALVATAVGLAEASGTPILGLTSDPADADVWQRNAPHIEQRLGPIDVVIAVGPPELRSPVENALAPDLAARHHGVVVMVGDEADATGHRSGVRFESVRPGDLGPGSLADAVLRRARAAAAGQDG